MNGRHANNSHSNSQANTRAPQSPTVSVSSPTRINPASPTSQRNYNPYAAKTPTQPNEPKEVVWKRKIKVDTILQVIKEHVFSLDDSHLHENDLFQL